MTIILKELQKYASAKRKTSNEARDNPSLCHRKDGRGKKKKVFDDEEEGEKDAVSNYKMILYTYGNL